jgi:TRAP-type C4-dicarboxylate transport system permease small subunit
VPFLGTTWQQCGAAYWRRRVGAVVLFTVLLAFVGGMSVGFGLGIAGGGHSATRIVLALLYALTAIPGLLLGRRTVANAPIDNSRSTPTTVAPIGLAALALAPFGTGLVLALLLSMFGRDFIGERRARSISLT